MVCGRPISLHLGPARRTTALPVDTRDAAFETMVTNRPSGESKAIVVNRDSVLKLIGLGIHRCMEISSALETYSGNVSRVAKRLELAGLIEIRRDGYFLVPKVDAVHLEGRA